MFCTVYEVANHVGIEPHRVYYMLRMSRVEGAFKVLNSWRLTSVAMREVEYFVAEGRRHKGLACNNGPSGLSKNPENFFKDGLPANSRQGTSCIQGRGRNLERCKGGLNILDRKTRGIKEPEQPYLFPEWN